MYLFVCYLIYYSSWIVLQASKAGKIRLNLIFCRKIFGRILGGIDEMIDNLTSVVLMQNYRPE